VTLQRKERRRRRRVCCLPESISSGAQYVTLRKYFSHPSLLMYSFATPPIKLESGQQIGEGLLIANQSETLSTS
jgi:hypothetical protein